jgi:hypothetical protein
MPGRENDGKPGEPQDAVADEEKRSTGGEAGDTPDAPAEEAGPPGNEEPSGPSPEPGGQAAAPPGDAEEAISGEADTSESQVETSYQATGRGHRVIRRTTKRRTTTEDIQEDIEEEYPLPAAYPVPGSTHPAPVG